MMPGTDLEGRGKAPESDGARAPARWRVWIDTGGTFTDCVALDPQGGVRRVKVLSSSALRATVERAPGPSLLVLEARWTCPLDFLRGFRLRVLGEAGAERAVRGWDPASRAIELEAPLERAPAPGSAVELLSSEEAPLLAARLATGVPPGEPLPPIEMRLATTRGTNALLERRGAPVALFITRGFGDLLRIGTQQRPDLFALEILKPEPLPAAVVEVAERLAADGSVLAPLDLDALEIEAKRVLASGIRSAAIALMHSHVSPRHEREVEGRLRVLGFEHVSASASLAPFQKLLHRAETAAADAYLAPVLAGYIARVASALPGGELRVMTSAGGLVRAAAFRAKDGLLSGPAGGVAGAARAAALSGLREVIAFDMGGTSTDVARWDGDFEYLFEHEVAGVRLVAPAVAVESVASGGGSICEVSGGRLRVGPRSAGASPGPACYGAGGPLTLTDVNLLLGRLDPSRFEIPVDRAPAEARLREVLEALERETGERADPDALLEGFVEVACERMAGAIRKVSAARGFDPAGHALLCFGGAGGQFACPVAERLGIGTVVVPADAGLLSALGLGGAVAERFAERQILEGLEEASGRLERWLEELEAEARRALEADGVAAGEVVVRRRIASLRLAGQDATLQVECGRGSSLAEAFAARYRAVYGHGPPRRPVELESLRVVASSRPLEAREAPRPARSREARPGRTRRARLGGAWRDARVFAAEVLEPGDRLRGPALVLEDHTTTVVDAGWRAEVDGAGALVLRREEPHGLAASPRRAPGAVELELFASRFRAIAVEMGEMLRRTALSVNVKERLDFSCALLDPAGRLVVNAPHIPVHLGALGLCVRSLRAALHLGPGDVAVTNHPALGGSHLPDVTVVRPIHLPGGELLGHVASRAHHAEIGGSAPGSMPPRARSLAEEGVVIPPTYLVRGGDARWEDLRRLLESGPYPSRAVEENLADLRAALAAGERGAQALLALASDHGSGTVLRFMAELERAAAARMRAVLRRLPPGRREAEERLDDGTSLRAAVDVSGGEARIDFTGTSGVHPGSLNATPGIVRSVVLYFLRLLAAAHPAEEAAAGGGEWLPLNEGLLEPVEIVVPPGLLDPPFAPDPAACPALAGGNVETSQRLVGVLLKAVGLMASSQGTMNNVVFGNERLGYYETVCGGAGAGPGFHGASAVHTHMTNTRITDPEVLEHRYPVRVERFALRRGSGGAGRWRGGDGVVREIAFLEPMTLSVLGQHRTAGPYGLEGGEPGMPAVQRLVRASGEVLELASSDGCEVRPGDRFVLETPGGGGYGSP